MSWLRHPRTTQERRYNGKRGICYDDGEYVVKIRCKRSQPMLPSLWDDIIRQDGCHRTWKRHRNTQYKVRG